MIKVWFTSGDSYRYSTIMIWYYKMASNTPNNAPKLSKFHDKLPNEQNKAVQSREAETEYT